MSYGSVSEMMGRVERFNATLDLEFAERTGTEPRAHSYHSVIHDKNVVCVSVSPRVDIVGTVEQVTNWALSVVKVVNSIVVEEEEEES